MLALDVFALTLRHFKLMAMADISDQVGVEIDVKDIQWVLTVPATWRQDAKQLIREAAYKVGSLIYRWNIFLNFCKNVAINR